MNDWWPWAQATFPNRQIATGIWLLIAFLLSFSSKNIRSSIGGVLKALLQRKLVLLFGSSILNVSILCWLFSTFGLWSPDQLPATVLWTVLSGFSLIGRTLSAKDDQGYFKRLFLDCFKIIVVLEFLIVGYSFSLPIELVLVPLMTFLVLLIEFSRTKVEYASVKKLFEWIAIAVTAIVLWKAVGNIWDQPDAFFTTKTGRNFLLPGLLTVASIPFLYIWYCYSHIENARIRINLKTFQSDDVKHYARRRFFLTFMTRPQLLRRATRQFHSMPARTSGDVDQIVSDILVHERRRKSPPDVDENLGWSPYLAREFLKLEGFETSDYHRAPGGDQWWVDSNHVDLDSQVLPNTASFYVEGLEDLATTLKLKGYFNSTFDPTLAKERFNEIAQVLLERSITGNLWRAQVATQSDEDFVLVIEKTRVARKTEWYPNQAGFELNFVLVRGNSLTSDTLPTC